MRRAMKLGAQEDPPLVIRIPHFQCSPSTTFAKALSNTSSLPMYARVALVILYHTGARKGEIRAIRVDKIDLAAKRIQLPGRTTKNGKPRYLPIHGDMGPELEMTPSKVDPNCPFLVQHEGQPGLISRRLGYGLRRSRNFRNVVL